jgi:hypothetical protein
MDLGQMNTTNSLWASTEIPTDMVILIPSVRNIGPNIPTIALSGDGKGVTPTNDTKGASTTKTPKTEPTSTTRWTSSDRSYFQSRKEKAADLAHEETEDRSVMGAGWVLVVD